MLVVLQLCRLQAVIQRYEAAAKRAKESRERIEADRREMSLMSARYQQLVERLSQLEAVVEQKKCKYRQVM